MTLYTSDYLEYFLTLVGWIINNGIWSVLVATGIVALPFLAIVLQEWLRSRTEGADEGNKGVLSSMRIENRVWVAIIVIMFAGIPLIPVDLTTIQFDRTRSAQCQVNVPLPAETGWEPAFTTLNNQTARVPVWWFFMHSLSKAITAAAVASIPCGTDLRQMRMEINSTRIDDPVLAQEVADFTRDCYGPARAKLFMGRPTLSEEEMNDVTWIGSSYFVDEPEFYDTYLDSTIMNALYGWDSPHSNFNALLGLNNTFGDMLVNWFVLPTMFLILPALWITALAWTGIQAGNVLQGLSSGTRAAGEAGSQGTKAAMQIVRK